MQNIAAKISWILEHGFKAQVHAFFWDFFTVLELSEWIDSFSLPGKSFWLKTAENVHTLREIVFLNVQLRKCFSPLMILREECTF